MTRRSFRLVCQTERGARGRRIRIDRGIARSVKGKSVNGELLRRRKRRLSSPVAIKADNEDAGRWAHDHLAQRRCAEGTHVGLLPVPTRTDLMLFETSRAEEELVLDDWLHLAVSVCAGADKIARMSDLSSCASGSSWSEELRLRLSDGLRRDGRFRD